MLIFDHQMCIDPDRAKIYVFGGQSLFINTTDGPTVSTSSEKMYSGLYEYHIPTNSWQKRRDDVACTAVKSNNELKSRSSHSMLFHHQLRKLFIFGGQRKGSEYLNDFFRHVAHAQLKISCLFTTVGLHTQKMQTFLSYLF